MERLRTGTPSDFENLMARATELTLVSRSVTVGDLHVFRMMAERVSLADGDVSTVLEAIKQAFASGIPKRVLFAAHILTRMLRDQPLQTDDVRWLFEGLVEIPQPSYAFGEAYYAFPRDDQYKMLAHANGSAVEGVFVGRVLHGEWIRACAGAYEVTHSAKLLTTLMWVLNAALHSRDYGSKDQRIALDVLAALGKTGFEDDALKEALHTLLMQQIPGSPGRSAVEETLLILAGMGNESQASDPATTSNGRTWIRDESVETLLVNACAAAEAHLSAAYETSPTSHEERLTGAFLTALETELNNVSRRIEDWASATFAGSAKFTCGYVDIASRGPEKLWGADVGFYIDVNVHEHIRFERSVLVQVKKAAPKGSRSWSIEPRQRDLLLKRSNQSVYMLYGVHAATSVLVVPATTVLDVMGGTESKSRFPHRARGAGRMFREFFIYDLIGDWWGDREGPAFDVVKGAIADFAVRWLFTVSLRVGFPG